MKKYLFTYCFLLICLLFSEASAQNFQPFRKGPTYHFIANDSIFSMRIDSVKMVNGDSVFVFNRTVKVVNNNPTVTCNSGQALVRAKVNLNNQFGHKMLKKTNGDFVFSAANGKEFTLKTKAATGQNWTFSTTPALTATLISKAVEPVSTVSDSVFTYSLSNGGTIKLSKNYGFVKAPNFAAYADNAFKPKTLDFYALPEKGLGEAISNPLKIYDFQPGDQFGYYAISAESWSSRCAETWTRIEILTRTALLNGVSYTIKRDRLYKSNANPGAPMGFCPGQPYHNITTTNETLNVYNTSMPVTSLLTGGYQFTSDQNGNIDGNHSNGISRTSNFNQRMQTGSVAFEFCPDSNVFVSRIDPTVTRTWFGVGLGLTRQVTNSYYPTYTEVLECYTKGTETYGNCLSFAQILASKEEIKTEPIKLSPNPFTSDITLKLSSVLQKGSFTVTILNMLGQEIISKNVAAGSSHELKLQTMELAKGMYLVQIRQQGKIYTSKVVKE